MKIPLSSPQAERQLVYILPILSTSLQLPRNPIKLWKMIGIGSTIFHKKKMMKPAKQLNKHIADKYYICSRPFS
jgi:hypothetical protein